MKISSSVRFLVHRPHSFRSLATLVATEEFPIPFTLSPKASSAAIIKESTLASGIKLISRENVTGTASIKVVVKGGSSAETLSEKGAAHLLSVSAFAGHGKKSGLKLMRALENIGAVVSSTSDREKITYNVSVLSDKVSEAFEIVAEAASLPLGAPYLLSERKETAQIAYDEKQTSPEITLSELLHESIFGETSPLGSSIFANKLDDVSFDDVLSYRTKVFVAGNTSVVGSGISHDALKSLVEAYLVLPAGTAPAPASPYVGGETRLRADLGTTHAALAFGISGPQSGKVTAIIGAVLKSRLAAAAGKGYSATAFSTSLGGTGVVGAYVNAPASHVGANLQLLADELRVIAKGGATAQIELAKTQLTLAATLALEGSSSADALASAFVTGQSVADSLSYAVDAKAVEAAAAQLLASVPSYAVVGVTAGVPSFSTVTALSKAAGVVPGL